MKLLRLGDPGREHPALLADDGRFLDLSGLTADIDGAFFASGGLERVRAAAAAGELPELDAAGLRTGAGRGVGRRGYFGAARAVGFSPVRGRW